MNWMLAEAYRLHGIVHGRFAEMLECHGAVGAAKHLIQGDFFDFDNFYPHEPNLWVETYVVGPHFAPLFSTEEIEIARGRLEVLRKMQIA